MGNEFLLTPKSLAVDFREYFYRKTCSKHAQALFHPSGDPFQFFSGSILWIQQDDGYVRGVDAIETMFLYDGLIDCDSFGTGESIRRCSSGCLQG